MKVLVIQSYRTSDVPSWINTCMESVRLTAGYNSWDYAFKGDTFLSMAPRWAIAKCGDNKYAVTDICRLQWIKQALAEYDRVIWFDADVLVFRPDRFKVDDSIGYGFAHEVLFVRADREQHYTVHESVNNAVMFFDRGHLMLDDYHLAVEKILREADGAPPRCALGPELLQRMRKARSAPIYGIGLFTFEMMHAIASDEGRRILNCYENIAGCQLTAANLCHFKRDRSDVSTRALFDQVYEKAVDWLRHES